MRYIISIILILMTTGSAYSQTSGVNGASASRKYVLILNSYSYGDNRVTRISKALRKEIEAKDTNLLVNITYADIGNRNSYQSDRFGMQGAFSSASISRNFVIPNILILIGDESWMLYRDMNLRGRWEKVPVVLCEMNDSIMADYRNFYRERSFADSLMTPIERSQKRLNATGVIKVDNTVKTLELITQLIPETKRIDYICTKSYRDEYTLDRLRKSIERQHTQLSLNVLFQTPNNKDSIKLMLSGSDRNSVILLCDQELDPNINKPTFVLNQHAPTNSSSIIGGYVALDKDMCRQVANTSYDILVNQQSILTTPFSRVNSYANVLDMQVVERFNLKEQADKLPNLLYINIPEPFFIRNFVVIMTIAIILVVIAILSIIVWRYRRNSDILVKSYENYKGLYNEYRAVYDNMPIGMILFDKDGSIASHNVESNSFLNTLSSYGLNEKSSLSAIKAVNNPDFEILYQTTLDEETAQQNTLMLIIDRSEVQRENEAKQKILDTMIFAIESSGWGVAQYNLVDYKGFATKNWYENLCRDESEGFHTAYNYLAETDRIKIENFLKRARNGEADLFLDTIRVDNGEQENWLRYAIKVLKYAPEQGQVLVVELMININDQKEQEKELTQALIKAQESYIFKNAFIANTGNEIREILNRMNEKIDTLLTSLDTNEQDQCAQEIEHDNKIMLGILKTIISISRPDYAEESDEYDLMK